MYCNYVVFLSSPIFPRKGNLRNAGTERTWVCVMCAALFEAGEILRVRNCARFITAIAYQGDRAGRYPPIHLQKMDLRSPLLKKSILLPCLMTVPIDHMDDLPRLAQGPEYEYGSCITDKDGPRKASQTAPPHPSEMKNFPYQTR